LRKFVYETRRGRNAPPTRVEAAARAWRHQLRVGRASAFAEDVASAESSAESLPARQFYCGLMQVASSV